MLTVAGLHVPVMPLSEVPGREGTPPPEQIFNVDPKLNAGVTLGLTVTVNVVGLAHSPAFGVKV